MTAKCFVCITYNAGVMSAVLGSFYEKPNRTVHFTNVACSGSEQTISECSKSSYSLAAGKTAISSVEVAGVQCLNNQPSMAPCLSAPNTESLAPQCNESDVRLVEGNSPHEGRLEFCYQQQWSPFCTLHHIEASVACKQLGYTQYTCENFITTVVTAYNFTSHQLFVMQGLRLSPVASLAPVKTTVSLIT